MDVLLTPELDAYVEEKVNSGRFGSASEVVQEGLRLMRRQEEADAEGLSEFRQSLAEAEGQIERGEYSEYTGENLGTLADDIKARGRQRLEARRAA